MKLSKLIGVFLLTGFLSSFAMALNFSGVQSISGYGTTGIFSAPVPGIYFVNGQLTLPMSTQNGNTQASQLVATVSKNYTTLLYTGLAGATGFQINQISLVTSDLITVGLATTVSADQVLNAVHGQVYFGNTF